MTNLRSLFDAQYRASREAAEVPVAERRDRVRRVQRLLDQHGNAISAAVEADFGVRSAALTEVADLLVLRNLLAQLVRRLGAWSRPVRVHTPLQLKPARAWIQRQPLGVVGVISPCTTVNSSGANACAMSSASSAEVRGVNSLGLSITRLPAASAVAAGPSESCSG